MILETGMSKIIYQQTEQLVLVLGFVNVTCLPLTMVYGHQSSITTAKHLIMFI